MRFHVVGLPHTNTTLDFTACAFTEKVRKFCVMMKSLGHTVYLYGGEFNEAPCDEHIPCITEQERLDAVGGRHYTGASFDYNLPYWEKFNRKVASSIGKRAEQKDFICVIGGYAHKQIADSLPHLMTVEFGIGYPGTFAKYRVFESYAWMHAVYGTTTNNAATLDGNFFDAVIPGYFEPEAFPLGNGDGDYLMFIGRLVKRKGYQIAEMVAEHLGERLIIAGTGETPSYGEHVGLVDAEERARLLGGAKAVFAPTLYVEPFGSVVPEAMMCGSPVITTDWGAFTEIVQPGTGFRCRTFGEFVEAAKQAPSLNRSLIRQYALDYYSLDAIAPQYERYFRRLLTLWDEGWYTI
jgi:glycosyltransferase involved in cell wall biosynthesis